MTVKRIKAFFEYCWWKYRLFFFSEMANAIGEPVDNILETLLDLFPKTVDTISPSKGHLISGRKKPL